MESGRFSDDDWAARLHQVCQQIPDTVRLIAVTKKFPAEVVRAAYGAGVRDFGESQVQEAEAKQAELTDLPDMTWHLIGHLQSNKARRAVELFDWIHSVDSLKLAKRLNHLAAEAGRSPQCCLQVKMVSDPPKYGFDQDQLWSALPTLDQLDQLSISGLMTIPPMGLSPQATRDVFDQARSLADKINAAGFERLQIQELSMGMSGDYPIAIAAGATMVRLGTALFGDRPGS
ncbi:YggS family pyridoxal phosphate-dependent enzyme [filamentous cyanobacterium CCP5]|nr:YggS family pyridoxal phosphate-dependent enzyme [filamentous cyanobacterium CCP5]